MVDCATVADVDGPTSPRPTSLELLYQAVADRRLQYENLLWQVPALSLTAQAFLFSIALSQGNDSLARIGSSLLALVVSIISIMLMASHRQAELRDTRWLELFEQEELRAGQWGAHGEAFRARHETVDLDAGWASTVIPLRHIFRAWVAGLGMFGLAAILVIVKTLLTLLF